MAAMIPEPRYEAEVITRDMGHGPVQCIRLRCAVSKTLIGGGYFPTVEALARVVDLAEVKIVEKGVSA